jgi:hypothetical protein
MDEIGIFRIFEIPGFRGRGEQGQALVGGDGLEDHVVVIVEGSIGGLVLRWGRGGVVVG